MELSRDYLTNQTTFEQAVQENTVDGIPFGFINDDWERLLANRREGDELWEFGPPNHNSIQLWGFALVRGGNVVSTVITAVD
jgi:hypothetical protein